MRRGIRINREYSNLHFGRQRRRFSGLLILLWALAMLAVAVVIWQFETIQPRVLAVVQPPPPTLTASQRAQVGYDAYLAGDLARAEAELGAAVGADPTNVSYLFEYGRMLMLQDKYEDALAVAEQAIAAAPADPRGYALKTYALDFLDRSEEAIPVGLTALELDPGFAPTYAYLSGAYRSTGRWGRAQELGARAVELDPNNIDARRAYALSLNWIGRNDLAVEQYEAAIAIHPNLDFLYFELAGAYAGLDREPSMIAIYEYLLEKNPENVQAMVRMCETYFGLRIDNYAQYYCEQALERDPALARAWKQVGMIYYTRRNYESAVDAFETCRELSGSRYVECWYLAGLAHYRLAQCELGVPLLQQALNYTDDPGIQTNILDGLYFCAESDDRFDFSIIPTPHPTPTPVPTPIGIF